MSLSREQFERIEQEELTPIPKRILNRILNGKTNQEIRKDETVWYNLDICEYLDIHKCDNIKQIVEQIKKEIEKLEAQKEKNDNQLKKLKKLKSEVQDLYNFRKSSSGKSKPLLSKHLRAICDKFRIKSTRNIEDDLLKVMKYFVGYKQDKISSAARARFELLGRIPYPGGSIPTYSLYYQYRYYNQNDYLENKCLSQIENAGKEAILIRIKGPHLMGKTSFKNRLLNNKLASNNQLEVVDIDLAEHFRIFQKEKSKIYHWFCSELCQQLGLNAEDIFQRWGQAIESVSDCTLFVEKYILSEIAQPILLSFDNFHKIFESSNFSEFSSLLRSWHDNKAKNNDKWRNLVLILTYSTSDYPRFNINQSPLFNLGQGWNLGDFNYQEIQELSDKHQLDWGVEQVEKLMSFFGGNPYLIRLALYHVAVEGMSLDTVLAKATTNEGIYKDHLMQLYNIVNDARLTDDLRKIVNNQDYIKLDSPISNFHLYSAGLVIQNNNKVKPRCRLYRDYFADILQ
ncbi:MAG: AAA-like domain-containing protein [Trichodesmium sp. MAG_R03]|nr:AAA-like domain-containing protein [Trichodesmium sp. MAG_R03]